MFKRTILAAIAFSMLAAPMAQAQSRHDGPRSNNHYSQPKPSKPAARAPQHRPQAQRPSAKPHHAYRPAPARHKWRQGQKVQNWQRQPHVRDYGRHGLRRPAKGQQWVKVDNDYLLISLATGVILGLSAGR